MSPEQLNIAVPVESLTRVQRRANVFLFSKCSIYPYFDLGESILRAVGRSCWKELLEGAVGRRIKSLLTRER
jgi:hypothetical protein